MPARQTEMAGIPAQPRSEEDVKSEITRALEACGCRDVRLGYSTGDGPCDLISESWFLIGETKKSGADPNASGRKKGETQREQLGRYLRAMENMGGWDGQWMGFIADGRNAYLYARGHGVAKPLNNGEPLPFHTPQLIRDAIEQYGMRPAKPGLITVPDNLYNAIADLYERSDVLWRKSSGIPDCDLKFKLWKDMAVASGLAKGLSAPQLHEIFSRHSFLVAAARTAVQHMLNPGNAEAPILPSHFAAWLQMEGNSEGRAILGELKNRFAQWSFRLTARDVFKDLYERLIDKNIRHDFGEAYTPDWLAEAICKEVLDTAWIKKAIREPGKHIVLDPSCGSGTFLFQAALRIMNHAAAAGLTQKEKANLICKIIHGMDIHPVAVEMAKATLMMALPAPPASGEEALHISQGDVFGHRVSLQSHFAAIPRDITAGKHLNLTPRILEHSRFLQIIKKITDIAKDYADPEAEKRTPEELRLALANEDWDREIPPRCRDDFRQDLQTLMEQVCELSEEQGNHVWEWYILNCAAPNRLTQLKPSRIVSNPPWVALRSMTEDRKQDLLNRLEEYDVHIGGRNTPHAQLAIPFVCEAIQHFLHPKDGRTGWVLPASAITAQPWEGFRKKHPHWKYIWDMSSLNPPPFSGLPCCALISLQNGKQPSPKRSSGSFESRIIWKTKPGFSRKQRAQLNFLPLEEYLAHIDQIPHEAFDAAAEPSPYGAKFRQGATIQPYSLCVVDRMPGKHHSGSCKRSTKGAWRNVPPLTIPKGLKGIRPIIGGKNIAPFRVHGCQHAILPIFRSRLDPEAMKHEFRVFWRKADNLWKMHGKSQRIPKLLNQLDYLNKLKKQLPISQTGGPCRVIYNLSGQDRLRAARTTGRAEFENAIIIESACRYRASSEDEALYLVGILNCPALQAAFVANKPSLRHFSLSPLRGVPVPEYNPKNALHKQIVKTAQACEAAAAELEMAGNRNDTKAILEELHRKKLLGKLDALVKKLLPKHAK